MYANFVLPSYTVKPVANPDTYYSYGPKRYMLSSIYMHAFNIYYLRYKMVS